MVAPTTRPYISAPMTRRFTRLAWTAATFTYLLIILGAIVRITGSGLGCGEHCPLCNGKLRPPLDLPTMIEYGHRLDHRREVERWEQFAVAKRPVLAAAQPRSGDPDNGAEDDEQVGEGRRGPSESRE